MGRPVEDRTEAAGEVSSGEIWMSNVWQQRFHAAQVDRAWLERIGWTSVDDLLTGKFDDVVAVSQSSDVACVPLDSGLGGPSTVFVKRYYYRRRSQRFKQMFRGTLFGKSRARREYEILDEMLRRGIPAVRPIAFGDRRKGLFLRASLLLTEGAPGAVSLDLFASQRIAIATTGRAERLAFINELATTVRAMHQAGIRHGGLFWRNILVHRQPDGGYRFSFLDPDINAKLLPTPLPPADAIADISEFAASGIALGVRGELIRFAKAYLGVRKLGADHRKLVAQVFPRAQRLARAERRRIATSECLDWLRRRIAQRSQIPERVGALDSLDQFFDMLIAFKGERDDLGRHEGRTIHFIIVDGRNEVHRHVIIRDGRIAPESSSPGKPDLVIRCDPQTWLAVLSGHADAYKRVQKGRLELDGDPRLLLAVVKCFDEAATTEAPSPLP